MTDPGGRIRALDPCRESNFVLNDVEGMSGRIVSGTARMPRRRRVSMLVASASLAVGLAVAGIAASDAASPPPPPNANETPPQLPASAGLSPGVPDWTLVSTGSSRIYGGKGESPVDSREMGLDGGLLQLWVSTSTAQEYGTGQGLPLPVPLVFAQAHPGPIEATVDVLSFSKPSSPSRLLANPQFSQIGEGIPGDTVVSGAGLNGGTAMQILSDGNGGLTEYLFQWASGSSWYQVAELGAGMSVQQAQRFAQQVGN